MFCECYFCCGGGRMLKLFLASHGHMASGMKNSVEILCRSCDNLTVFDAYVDQDSVADHLDVFYKTVTPEDKVVLMSDLYGGSVNQQMYLYLDRGNTTLVAGVNLAFVLELAVREEISLEEIVQLVEQSRTMLRIVEKENSDTNNEEDFF